MANPEITLNSYQIGPSSWGHHGAPVVLNTAQGRVSCLLRQYEGSEHAVLWAGALRGEETKLQTSPISDALSRELLRDGVTSLMVRYRSANNLEPCVKDVQSAIVFLEQQGIQHIALVGHSFSGAVVISVAPMSRSVACVATLASQTYGTRNAPHISPRPLLLIHGTADQRLGPHCSEQIYSWSNQPKHLVFINGGSHGLWESKDQLLPVLRNWLNEKLLSAV